MKRILHFYLFVVFLCSGCFAQENNFTEIILGGVDLHGELYRKKYKKPNDTNIHYSSWTGYEVSSNAELEDLFKVKPNCEAIRFVNSSADKTAIDLSPIIGEFENLKFLYINNGRVVNYPKSIENLKKIEELILRFDMKKTVEFDFSKFTNLKHLTLHYMGNLSKFPYSIFDCKKLETLKLFRCNQVEDNVLKGIEKLVNLREIYIFDSNLILPDAEYDYKQLETLIVDRCRTKLPEYFWDLQTIKRFGLSGSSDTLDLNNVSKMRGLEALSLYYQKDFKGKLDLPKIEHLHISNFYGKEINVGINSLSSLESLVIWGCRNIKYLDNISNENLKSITVNSNDKLVAVKLDKAVLQRIEEVEMKYNDILKIDAQTIEMFDIKVK